MLHRICVYTCVDGARAFKVSVFIQRPAALPILLGTNILTLLSIQKIIKHIIIKMFVLSSFHTSSMYVIRNIVKCICM